MGGSIGAEAVNGGAVLGETNVLENLHFATTYFDH